MKSFLKGHYWLFPDNVWCIKNCTKLSCVLLLCLVRFFMHQTLYTRIQSNQNTHTFDIISYWWEIQIGKTFLTIFLQSKYVFFKNFHTPEDGLLSEFQMLEIYIYVFIIYRHSCNAKDEKRKYFGSTSKLK